jgi:hypothetical protein
MSGMRRAMTILTTVLLAAALAPIATGAATAAPPSASPVTLTTLVPNTIVDETGIHTGAVASLAVADQSGTQDDASSYVRFDGGDAAYAGYRTYTLPSDVDPTSITTMTVVANFRGPVEARNPWTWRIYDWTSATWVRVGDQDHCGGDRGTEQWPCDDLRRAPWKYGRDNVITTSGESLADFVDPTTREIRLELVARRAGAAKLDAESLDVYSNDRSTDAALWTPEVGVRWQWQLEAAAGEHEATNGIFVDICVEPFHGGDGGCVRPDVFDIDVYVDPQIAGRYGWDTTDEAVAAIHDSDRHAIGDATQGDAERWRPDFEQFVDFDERCGGCLLGKPFSRRFPDERWANFSPGRGRFDFMLQMMRARTDRIAATGFDGIEYDIADTYAQGRHTTGFRLSEATQLAYNIALTEMAHADGLAVALKNDLGQIDDLVEHYDLAINEQCQQYDECGVYSAFIDAGKPVLEAEYHLEPRDFCSKAEAAGRSAIKKATNYSLYARPYIPCS